MRRSGVAICGIGVAAGLVVEIWAFDLDEPLIWLPDLTVGLSLIGAGAAAADRARGTAMLLVATGITWFLGTVIPEATYWHRGPLIHLLVAYPGSRPTSPTRWVVMAVGYVVAAVTPLWRNEATSLALATAALVLCVAAFRTASARRQRTRQLASAVGAGLAAVLIAGAVARLIVPAGAAAAPSLLAYEVALVVVAIVILSGLRPAGTAVVTDLVVELGETRSATMRDALADLLGDPTLRLGYWQSTSLGYVDSVGMPLVDPRPGHDNRVMTTIERDGQPFAALVHGAPLTEDSTFSAAFAAADRLTSAHAALQSDIRARVSDMSESRRRLQIAGDEERRRLERRLAAAPESRLAAMLGELRVLARPGDAHLERALSQLEQTLLELRDAAYGLYPRDLTGGLSHGLEALSNRSPVPVKLSMTGQRFDPQIEVAVYYLCAEALTNVAKHAQASAASVDVAVLADVLTIEVADDGIGGALPARGSGILGLIDRVESIGGALSVDSHRGDGTKLTAAIPLDGQPR